MFRFLEDRFSRLPSDELGALLGELALRDDGKPGDLAIIEDWEKAVKAIKDNQSVERPERIRSLD